MTNDAMTNESANALSGKIICHAMWAPDGRKLADFYAAALGTEVSQTFRNEHGNEAAFAFYVGDAMYLCYTSASFTAPDWPADELSFHMDLVFDDVKVAEKRLLELGATRPDHQPGGTHWTVLLDPSGQPFCIHGAR